MGRYNIKLVSFQFSFLLIKVVVLLSEKQDVFCFTLLSKGKKYVFQYNYCIKPEIL